ncbi:ceramide kinase [Clonorchis sinensis]|uniref:Ceramide kinase n=1 Tax=Clonorchis sinensis TaxID=79923 RepID=G7YWT5_CLOSI|nr:ceramide kinase [Clonorchis sinensis]
MNDSSTRKESFLAFVGKGSAKTSSADFGCSVCSLSTTNGWSPSGLSASKNGIHPRFIEALPSPPQTASMTAGQPVRVRHKSVTFYVEQDQMNSPDVSQSRARSTQLLLSGDRQHRSTNSSNLRLPSTSPTSSEDSGFHHASPSSQGFSPPSIFSSPSWSVQGCENGWKTFTGQFIAINAFLQSCRCMKAASGPSPWTHLGDGCLDLILVNKCTRKQFLQFLVRTANVSIQPSNDCGRQQCSPFDLPFVRVERVCAFEFKGVSSLGQFPLSASCDSFSELNGTPGADDPYISDSTSCGCSSNCCHRRRQRKRAGGPESVWCADGEVVPHTNVGVFVHRHLIRLFARGPEPLCLDALDNPVLKEFSQSDQLFNLIASTFLLSTDHGRAGPVHQGNITAELREPKIQMNHPPVIDMVKAVANAAKDCKGTSLPRITMSIAPTYKVNVENLGPRIRCGIVHAIEKGVLVRVGNRSKGASGRFKVAVAKSKAVKKPKAFKTKKPAAPKKPKDAKPVTSQLSSFYLVDLYGRSCYLRLALK